MVLRRGQVVAHGELRGKKKFISKPLLVAPAITCLCEFIALGHIYEGAKGKGSTLLQGTILGDLKVGGRLSLAVALNLAGAPKSQIGTIYKATVHYGDETCLENNFLERSHN
jgi:hypothetical protein